MALCEVTQELYHLQRGRQSPGILLGSLPYLSVALFLVPSPAMSPSGKIFDFSFLILVL